MRAFRFGVVALAALLLEAHPAPGAEGLQLLFPPDLTLATDTRIKVFAFRAEKGGPDNVFVNGVPAAPLEGETFLKGEVSLFPGLNIVQVGGTSVRVFVLANVKMDSFRLPTGKGAEELVFQVLRLHPALDDGCDGCHSVEGGKLKQKELKEACYACHNDFSKAEGGKKVFVHAPVQSGECTGCHDPHYSFRPKLQKLEKGCLECHDPFPEGKSVHRPAADGECVACHSPHAGPAPKQLVRPGNALCFGCHESVHPQHRSAIPRGTLTKVPDDFPREKDTLACRGCHAPHQAAEANLLNGRLQDLCKTCHRF